MTITVLAHVPGEKIDPFIRAADEVFRGDPAWVPPLDLDIKERLHPEKNPFFKRAEVALFTAWRGERLVGRCSAQIDREHLRLWKDDTGFFGFFDTIDDAEVGRALIDAAAKWLAARGMKRMMGPMSLYVNEEIGILVEGFEHPPVLMMGHSRDWQARVATECGLVQEKDLLCWRYTVDTKFPDRVVKAWEQVKTLPEVRLRSVDPKNMQRELEAIMDIYNDAWAGKWAMVPALPDEVEKVAKDLKLILDPDLAFIAEVNGRPAGMCIMLPNVNEAIQDLDGSLFPLGLFKLLWRVKVKHPKSCAPDDARHQERAAPQHEALRRTLRGHVHGGREAGDREGVPVERAVLDAGGRRPDQPRDPVDGGARLQEVPGLPEEHRLSACRCVVTAQTVPTRSGGGAESRGEREARASDDPTRADDVPRTADDVPETRGIVLGKS